MTITIKHCPICKHDLFWSKPDYKPDTYSKYIQCVNCWSIINISKAIEIQKRKNNEKEIDIYIKYDRVDEK